MQIKVLVSIVILSFSLNIYAQNTISDNIFTEQIWLDYNPSYKFNKELVIYGDIGVRTIFPHEWNRFVIRPSISYNGTSF